MRWLIVTIRRGPNWRVGIFVVALLAVAMFAAAQQPKQVYRIGFLALGHRPASDTATTSPLTVFRQALRELGYIEGRNLVLEERWAESHLSRS
jgi:putative ABC transport system substrate-binding protein